MNSYKIIEFIYQVLIKNLRANKFKFEKNSNNNKKMLNRNKHNSL